MKLKKFLISNISILVFVSFMFNYPTSALYAENFDVVVQPVIASNFSENSIEVLHYELGSKELLIASEKIIGLSDGEVIQCKDYIKDIDGYTFKNVKPKTLIVGEMEQTVRIYYKKKK